MNFTRWVSDEWKNAWTWLSVQLGAVIAVAPAIYENLDVVQDFIPRPYFAAAQGVLGALVMLNAVKKKAKRR